MALSAGEKFRAWLTATCPREALIYFRVAFAGIWLVYDVVDFAFGQTEKIKWIYDIPVEPWNIKACLGVLIFCECGLLFGRHPRLFAATALLARAFEASFIPLNDFYYFCVMALLLAVGDSEWRKDSAEALAWPRDVMILQTGWIYFATALLKLSPQYLSGGDLYVRQNYVASVLPLPYPDFYRAWIGKLWVNELLAWSGIVMELTLALALWAWWYWPGQRARLRVAAIALVILIHGYAALTVNVFFFGASMIAQVVFLTKSRKST